MWVDGGWGFVLWVLVGFEILQVLKFGPGCLGLPCISVVTYVVVTYVMDGVFWMAWVWLLGMIWVFCSDGLGVLAWLSAYGVGRMTDVFGL